MEPIVIIVREIGQSGRHSAALSDGTLLLESSASPFLEGCRRLLALGYAPEARAVMRRPGSDEDCLRSTIGGAARLSVSERGFSGYRPGGATRKPHGRAPLAAARGTP